MKRIILGLSILLTGSCFSTEKPKDTTSGAKVSLIVESSNIDYSKLKPGYGRLMPNFSMDITYENISISRTEVPKALFTRIHSLFRKEEEVLKQMGFYGQGGVRGFGVSPVFSDSLYAETRYISLQDGKIENHLSLVIIYDMEVYANEKSLKIIGIKVLKGTEIPNYSEDQLKKINDRFEEIKDEATPSTPPIPH